MSEKNRTNKKKIGPLNHSGDGVWKQSFLCVKTNKDSPLILTMILIW